jgi:hypothetical protein
MAYATLVLVRGASKHVLYHLDCSSFSSHVVFHGIETVYVEHPLQRTKRLRQKVTSLYTCVCYLLLVVKTPSSALHMTRSNGRIRCIILAGQVSERRRRNEGRQKKKTSMPSIPVVSEWKM